jgi:hypothetical protein
MNGAALRELAALRALPARRAGAERFVESPPRTFDADQRSVDS